MLRIGYVRLLGSDSDDEVAALKATGCHVVRVEAPGDGPGTLASILEFIGIGDQLVVPRLDQLAASSRDVLDAIERLHARGASLQIIEPELCSLGAGGAALRAALEAVARLEPLPTPRRRPAAAQDIHALQQAGLGPVEIARRLGVSRMTVWRKLRTAGPATLTSPRDAVAPG